MEHCLTYRKVIVADKMGLGKSLSTLAAGYQRGLRSRTLIVCSQSALSVWPKEIDKWFPELSCNIILVEGTKQKRRKLWERADEDNIIFICTFGTYLADKDSIPLCWDLVFADEGHKARNHKTKLWQALHKLVTDDIYIITGTPAPKGPRHMWGYLNWLYPKQFPSYWGFLNKFCIIEEGAFGKEFVGVQNMDLLKQLLSKIMIRHKSAGNNKFVKRRHILEVEMTKEEERIYMQMDTEQFYNRADGTFLLAPSAMSARLRCRQLFICPQLLDPALGAGSGMEYILQHADDQELDHFVIFTPFPSAFDFMKQAIWNKLQVTAHTLRGGMSSEEVKKAISDWEKSPKGVMLCSIKFATSFELVFAKTAYFLGFEWDADDNYQAEDRLYRPMIIKEDVNIYYVMHNNVLAVRQKQIVDQKYSDGKAMGL